MVRLVSLTHVSTRVRPQQRSLHNHLRRLLERNSLIAYHRKTLSTLRSRKQDRQSTYNVIMTCFPVTNVAMEKQQVLNIMRVCPYSCIFSVSYYIVIRDLSSSNIFFHDINNTIFEKKVLNVIYFLLFSLKCCQKNFYFKEN